MRHLGGVIAVCVAVCTVCYSVGAVVWREREGGREGLIILLLVGYVLVVVLSIVNYKIWKVLYKALKYILSIVVGIIIKYTRDCHIVGGYSI